MSIETRQEELINATITCLKKDGYKGLSIRKIADCAGVSTGLINHHFGSIEKLVAISYEYLAQNILNELINNCENKGSSPQEKIHIFIESSFISTSLSPDLLNAWIVFWGMSIHSKEIDNSHSITYSRYLDFISNLLTDLWNESSNEECDLRLATISFSALLDGLWVESCLNAKKFKSEDAINICKAWVKSFTQGMFII